MEPGHAHRPTGSSSRTVPSTLVLKKRSGSSTARLLCDSAAKFTTTSMWCSRISDSTVERSPMPAWANVIRSATGSRLARLPA
ncbi:MAG TPA: hypothetical protein VIS06_03100 [Mycobacteriales bacterium]